MTRLNKDIPALRMAVFAHGDYCDTRTYVTKWLDFSTDVNELCDFVKNVGSTGGGDFPECYELVLRQVREELSWTTGTQRSLVMIGDAIPHEANDSQNKQKIDWKEEVERLYNEMVRHNNLYIFLHKYEYMYLNRFKIIRVPVANVIMKYKTIMQGIFHTQISQDKS